ncbi:3-deoxy-D-manno-octulosonic acid transferase [Roseovarius sp. SYSU LYC5161]|uniref:3-deoxy-D-manno-octulosonic acid transferase n=1 Tax=Roseovarius halophilus (ex Wu et al. 2025) TaxID=3376060 RepID=UPI003999BB37
MSGAAAPLPIRVYNAAVELIAPLAWRRVSAKLRAQGVADARLHERLGRATAQRPDGRLVWFHAASVGESLSILRLIDHWGRRAPDLAFLITSGTASSAKILTGRLPRRTQHQFAPLDTRRAVARFLDHWRPDAAIFVESELWPRMLQETRARGVPLALVNARLSDRSARGWQRFARTARYLLAPFEMIHCQDQRTADHLQALGLAQAAAGQNLKSLAGPLPHDPSDLDALRRELGPRPVWLASSTHPGEDEIMLAAHREVRRHAPDALLILVPRHPDRASQIAAQITAAGLAAARRSTGEEIGGDTAVYLADTLGETGLWYALCPVTCLCGSFTPVGGHNPYEPAHAGSAILHGPLYANFAQAYPALDRAGAGRQVADAQALAGAVTALLADGAARAAMQEAATAFARGQQDVLDEMTGALSNALGLR